MLSSLEDLLYTILDVDNMIFYNTGILIINVVSVLVGLGLILMPFIVIYLIIKNIVEGVK